MAEIWEGDKAVDESRDGSMFRSGMASRGRGETGEGGVTAEASPGEGGRDGGKGPGGESGLEGGLVGFEEAFGRTGGRWSLCRALSLTAEVDDTWRLSKSITVGVVEDPRMVQSEVSSTGSIKVGKVRKLPLLSAMKLHPGSRQNTRTESRGLLRVGTQRTSCRVMPLPRRENWTVPMPVQGT